MKLTKSAADNLLDEIGTVIAAARCIEFPPTKKVRLSNNVVVNNNVLMDNLLNAAYRIEHMAVRREIKN
jgi:hypothetical protein